MISTAKDSAEICLMSISGAVTDSVGSSCQQNLHVAPATMYVARRSSEKQAPQRIIDL